LSSNTPETTHGTTGSRPDGPTHLTRLQIAQSQGNVFTSPSAPQAPSSSPALLAQEPNTPAAHTTRPKRQASDRLPACSPGRRWTEGSHTHAEHRRRKHALHRAQHTQSVSGVTGRLAPAAHRRHARTASPRAVATPHTSLSRATCHARCHVIARESALRRHVHALE